MENEKKPQMKIRTFNEEENSKINSEANLDSKSIPINENFELIFEEKTKEKEITYWKIITNLFPNTLIPLMLILNVFFETSFIGSIHDLNIFDGVGIGVWFRNIFFCFTIIGLAEGLPILGSMSFGSKKYKLLGHQLNLVFILCYSVLLLGSILYIIFHEQFLIFVVGGNQPYLEVANRYILICLPAFFMEIGYYILARYSEIIENYKIVNYITVISTVAYLIFLYIFISLCNFKEIGAALTFNICAFAKLVAILIYLKFYNTNPESLFLINQESFNPAIVKEFLKVTFLCFIIYFSECAGVWLLYFVASKFTPVDLGMYIVLTNCYELNFAFIYGLITTISMIIGSLIGQKEPEMIKSAASKIFIIGIIVESIISIFFLILHTPITKLMSGNNEVAQNISPYFLAFSFYLFIHLAQALFLGFLRISNQNLIPLIVAPIGYLLVLPILANVFALVIGLNLWGIILAEVVVYFLVTLIFFIFYLRIDFYDICKEVNVEINNNEEHASLI